jgi:hypothetical protein
MDQIKLLPAGASPLNLTHRAQHHSFCPLNAPGRSLPMAAYPRSRQSDKARVSDAGQCRFDTMDGKSALPFVEEKSPPRRRGVASVGWRLAAALTGVSRRRGFNSSPDWLRSLALLRHACDVTVGIKLDPIGAFFDGRHALRVCRRSCMYRGCGGGCFSGTGINT